MPKKPKLPPKPWPRLSETLADTGPGCCQACGSTVGVSRWNECDEDDQPEPVAVTLCGACSDRLIEDHPRLYRQLLDDEPMPGSMPICADCPARKGVRCTSPVAGFNGGPGLDYEPKPYSVHLCRSPRRLSGWKWLFPGPVKSCSGKASDASRVG